MVNHLIDACPNIESLQLGYKEYGYEDKPASVDFLSAIRFHNLRSLSLIRFQLQDGSFLSSVIRNHLGITLIRPFTLIFLFVQILKQCPKLERLHLTGGCIPDSFLLNIGQCLPLATKLRDLRYTANLP